MLTQAELGTVQLHDRSDQLGHAAEGASPNPLARDLREKTLAETKPRRAELVNENETDRFCI